MSKLQLLDENKKVIFSVNSTLSEPEDLICRIRKLLVGEKLEIVKCDEVYKIKNKAIRLLWILAGLPQLYSESEETEYFICYIRFICGSVKVFQLN
jgi:hypothetical protein